MKNSKNKKERDLSLTEWIDHWTNVFPEMTQEESDLILEILQWPEEKRAGFTLAKQIFEDRSEWIKNQLKN